MPAMSQPRIRMAKAADAEALLALIAEHAAFEKEAYSPEGKLEKIRACLSADPPPFTCLVVETDEGVQGFATGVPAGAAPASGSKPWWRFW